MEEARLSAADVVAEVDFALDIPSVAEILASPEPCASDPESWVPLAEAVCGVSSARSVEGAAGQPRGQPRDKNAPDFTDPLVLGRVLRTHFLTRVVVDSLCDGPLAPAEVVARITQAGVLSWGVHNTEAPEEVQQALLRFLALVSVARDADSSGRPRPLVSLQVQLWVRELTRMLRRVDGVPRFAWWHDAPDEQSGRVLPAAHCRACGRSGWMATTTELGDTLGDKPLEIWRASARHGSRSKTRAVLLAGCDEDDVQFLDPQTLELSATPKTSTAVGWVSGPGVRSDGQGGSAPEERREALPVLVTASDEEALAQQCPSCGAQDAIRFLGSSVATLLSVGLTQMFGSDLLPDSEKKTLVFTDSVQDAAHRAAFIEGRAFQFNFRSAFLGAVAPEGSSLAEAADVLADSLSTADLYAVAPPDFVRRLDLSGEWLAHDRGRKRRLLLANRIRFQSQLEVGLNARLGRTLELTGALGVDIDVDVAAAASLARDIHHNLPLYTPLPLEMTEALAYERWLLGLLERLRTRGGIFHPWLNRYANEDGRRWSIWGQSAPGMPKFPRGRPAPGFFTTAAATTEVAFETLNPRKDSWLSDWTRRCLGGVPREQARGLLGPVLATLAVESGPLSQRTSTSGAQVYGLEPAKIRLRRVRDEELADGSATLRCPQCLHVQPCTPATAELWNGAPCPRMRCQGILAPLPRPEANFYRRLYRSGRIRRIVTHEHTSLLDGEARQRVEEEFKAAASPVAPNILTCTPTLELGIDVGDLSTVTLASLPRAAANYLQRVGRAGRATGNAFVLAAVPSHPRDLYYFAEPKHLLDGEVVPPAAYLRATELLRRQFFAFCLDRIAAGELDLHQAMPRQLGGLLSGGMADGAWLRTCVTAVQSRAGELSTAFLDLYGGELDAAQRAAVEEFGCRGLEATAAQAVVDWDTQTGEISTRLAVLAEVIKDLSAQGHLDDQQTEDRRRCSGESRALRAQRRRLGDEDRFAGLARIGLLPNYNLHDDATTLDVHLWWQSPADDGGANSQKDRSTEAIDLSYERTSSGALTELAPGAYFYAEGKRVEIDAVEVGPPGQPLWRTWRLCPSCGYGRANAESGGSPCPRCGSNAVTDAGSMHKVLPLQRVSAVHRLDEALIDDDDDERTRTFFSKVTAVDIEPSDVRSAWRLADRTFGAEYARRATIRTLNFGIADAGGGEIEVAGQLLTAARFRTCAHCGVVHKRRVDPARVRHRGFCATRRSTPERWEELVLSHELVTQAVRLLLPVSMLEVQTQLVSFMGAVMLGLRRDFGGDPQHLAIITSSMRDGDGQMHRFLVLHDTVPGGTGYLDRFGEPERLRDILTKAREALATCPCRTEERAACHRCLLGVIDSGDVDSASRQTALDTVADLLEHWDVQKVESVREIDIAPVQASELERRFRDAVKAWADGHEGSSWTTSLGPQGEQLDLRLRSPSNEARRWQMRPLINVRAGALTTQPDFVFTRSDAQDCEIAVYLDGRRYHADVECNRSGDDARKRAALRDDGWRTWSITWRDVEEFAEAVTASGAPAAGHARQAPALVGTETQNAVRVTVGDPRVRSLWGNPMAFLLSYLADPSADVWADGARETVFALLDPRSGGALIATSRAEVRSVLLALADREPVAAGGKREGSGDPSPGGVVVVACRGTSGLPLIVVADPADHVATLGVMTVLDDRPQVVGGPEHEAHWRDWLRWSNVLQFLTLPVHGYELPLRMAEIWTASSSESLRDRYLPLARDAASPPALVAKATSPFLDAAWQEVARYTDPALRDLLVDLAGRGTQIPEAGAELGPDDDVWQVELSWPVHQVAVVVDHDAQRDTWLAAHGWRIVAVVADPDADAGPSASADLVALADLAERIARLLHSTPDLDPGPDAEAGPGSGRGSGPDPEAGAASDPRGVDPRAFAHRRGPAQQGDDE